MPNIKRQQVNEDGAVVVLSDDTVLTIPGRIELKADFDGRTGSRAQKRAATILVMRNRLAARPLLLPLSQIAFDFDDTTGQITSLEIGG